MAFSFTWNPRSAASSAAPAKTHNDDGSSSADGSFGDPAFDTYSNPATADFAALLNAPIAGFASAGIINFSPDISAPADAKQMAACPAPSATLGITGISLSAFAPTTSVVTQLVTPGLDPVGAGGSTALHADTLRSTFGVDGTGIKIGVLSDSFNVLGGAAADMADGALPAAGVQVIQEGAAGSSDEGRAMLELVHQIAPGASLAFATAGGGDTTFANNITALVNAGCNIIIDDAGYFDEPMFQEGVISQAIDNAVARGAMYFTSAGNDASNAYQANWSAVTPQTVTIGNGSDIVFELQWSQPAVGFATSLGMTFTDGFGDLITATEEGGVDFNGKPVTLLELDNQTGAAVTGTITINNLNGGPNPGLVKLLANGDGQPVSIADANSGTVTGHAEDPNAITVAAANSANDQLEPFSSSGAGAEWLFSANGTPINELLNKVDLSGVDGITTSVAGGLADFFGTSAAAPTAAAVAALLEQAAPGAGIAAIEAALENTATNLGDPSTLQGHGLVNGLAAGDSIATPHVYRANDSGDKIYPGTGDNNVLGGAGNDTIFITQLSFNAINGAGGTNTLDYSAAPAGVNVSFANPVGIVSNGFGGTDTFTNIQDVNGSAFNDTFVGGPGSHVINGGGGTNTLDYSAATGAVSVNLTGSENSDFGTTSSGFGGTDAFSNIQTFRSGSGNDTFALSAPTAFDYLLPLTLNGGGGTNTLDWSGTPLGGEDVNFATDALSGVWIGQFSNFQIFKTNGASFIFGGPGNHTIIDGGNDTLDYSAAPGLVTINLAAHSISNGFGGTDTFTNAETFRTGIAGASIIGGLGNHLFFTAGVGTVDYSAATNPVIINYFSGAVTNGFGGIDQFDGGFSSAIGGSGNDTFIGVGAMSDGGGGTNTLDLSGASSPLVIDLGAETVLNAAFLGATPSHFKNFQIFFGSSQFDDTFVGGSGSHTIIGGNQVNTIDYSGASAAINVSLATGVASNGFGGTDQLTNFQIVKGSTHGGTLTGGPSNDTFVIEGGNNVIDGGGGSNTIDYSAAPGPVTVNLGTGVGSNGSGTDTFVNIQFVRGGTHGSTLIGGSGNETFFIAGGNNTVDGGTGTNTLDYSGATSAVTINLAAGTASNGFGGTDTFTNIQDFNGASFALTTYIAGPGSHTFILHQTTTLDYSAAPGSVTVNATTVTGTISNGYGGTDQFDSLAPVTIKGSAGNNTFLVGLPNSYDLTFDGGVGTNTLDFSAAQSPITVNLRTGFAGYGGGLQFSNIQIFKGSSFNNTFIGGTGSHTLDAGGGVNTLDYSAAPGAMTVNLAASVVVNGFGGTDQISNFQIIKGGVGNDTFIGTSGNHTLDGGGGVNTLDYSAASGAVTINLAAGTAINGFGGTDQISNFQIFKGGSANDTFVGGSGSHTFDGGSATNTVDYSAAPGAVTVNFKTGIATNGFGGTDTFSNIEDVTGSAQNDTFIAGPGNDTINGGGGINTIVYDGQSSQYTITAVGVGTFDIADQRSGAPDGNDIVSNIEDFQFANALDTLTAPIVTALALPANTATVSASSLVSASDGLSSTMQEYQFVDETADPLSGHFVLNGVAQAANQLIDVTAAQLSGLSFQRGSVADTVEARASDGIQFGNFSTFTVAALPDLTAYVTLANTTIAAGGNASITLYDLDLGGGAAAASTTAIYLSTDGMIDTGDTLLATTSVGALAAYPGTGYFDKQNLSVALPGNLAPGTYTLGAIANYDNSVAESNTANNNFDTVQITVAAPARPDLTAYVALASSSLAAGGSEGITLYDLNLGMGAAGASTTAIYLSNDGMIDTGDTLLATTAVGTLAAYPGTGYFDTQNLSVTLPGNLTAGTYYIGAIANYNNAIAESNTGNNNDNVMSITVAAPAPPMVPDLTAYVALANTTIASGGNASITLYDLNLAAGAAGASTTAIYLSNDGMIDTGDTLLATTAVGTLAAYPGTGYFDTQNLSVALPGNLTAGTYYIGAIANYNNAIAESNTGNNNDNVMAITVTAPAPPALPDLTAYVSLNSMSLAAGGSTTVTLYDINLAAGAAGASTTAIYLSNDGMIDTGDTLLATAAVGTLAAYPGAGYFDQQSISVTLPGNLAAGTYYIGAIANYNNAISESNTGNNNFDTVKIMVAAPAQPDLTAYVSLSSMSLAAGGSENITLYDINLGMGAAAASTTAIYLSNDGMIDTGDTLLATTAVGALNPYPGAGYFDQQSISVTLPGNLAAGTYYIGAIANYNNAVPETNTGNNNDDVMAITVGPQGSHLAGGNISLGVNTSVAASALFTATPAPNDPITGYQFTDSNSSPGGSHFALNGVAEPANQPINVSVAQFVQGMATFVAGSSAATDTLAVRAADATGWSAWHTLTATSHT